VRTKQTGREGIKGVKSAARGKDVEDWAAVQEAWNRLEDARTVMPLYTSAVEGEC
jgi:hypothetical protein